MKYKNIKTGVEIETTSEVRGGDWQAVMPATSVKSGSDKDLKVAPAQPRKRGKAND